MNDVRTLNLNWFEVFSRLKDCPPGKVWGVPRGGAIVAGMTGRAVDSVSEADVIVDDIVDSGKTRERWTQMTGKPFWALMDKPAEGIKAWVKFPWEDSDPHRELEDSVVRILEFIGENPTREGLLKTPSRVIKAISELTEGYGIDPKVILSTCFEEPYDEMVIVKDIHFWSLCEHHLLPFQGTVTVGYLPKGKVIGLSKIPRLVHCFSRRLQVQERMTQQIAQSLMDILKPSGVGVYVRGHHTGMSMRGAKSDGDMITSCLLGEFRNSPETRHEFLAAVKKN